MSVIFRHHQKFYILTIVYIAFLTPYDVLGTITTTEEELKEGDIVIRDSPNGRMDD